MIESSAQLLFVLLEEGDAVRLVSERDGEGLCHAMVSRMLFQMHYFNFVRQLNMATTQLIKT